MEIQNYANEGSRTIPKGDDSEIAYIRKISILTNLLPKKGSVNFKFKKKHPSEMKIPVYSIEG